MLRFGNLRIEFRPKYSQKTVAIINQGICGLTRILHEGWAALNNEPVFVWPL